MSRFGLRKKLKSLLAEKKSSYQTYDVTFILPGGSEKTVSVEERYNLLMASQSLTAPIGTGRRAGGSCPDGGCASCQVEILDATGLSPQGESEKKTLEDYLAGTEYEGHAREPGQPIKDNTRLACYTRVIGSGGRVQVRSIVDFDALQGN